MLRGHRGERPGDHKWANQILAYATVAGVEWVALTDGNEDRLYNSHAIVPVEEKLFRTVRIVWGDAAAALRDARLLLDAALNEIDAAEPEVEPCDECSGTRWPVSRHEPSCSLYQVDET